MLNRDYQNTISPIKFARRCLLVLSATRLFVLAILIVAAAFSLKIIFPRPKAWAANETPIAFWAWQSSAPAQADIDNAKKATKSNTLFLHAGQLDYDHETIKIARGIAGNFPRNININLVYN